MNERTIKEIRNIFDKYCASYTRDKGEHCVKNGLVKGLKAGVNNKKLTLLGKVHSEDSSKEYSTLIKINLSEKILEHTRCSCNDYRSNAGFNDRYICKHIAASFYRYTDILNARYGSITVAKDKDAGRWLLQKVNSERDKARELVSIDVYLKAFDGEDDEAFYEADFKIGNDKMYVMKSIDEFLSAKSSGKTLEYGKKFIYDPSIHYFSKDDEGLLNFIEEYGDITRAINSYPIGENGESLTGTSKILKGKSLFISQAGLKRFLKAMGRKAIYIKAGDDGYRKVSIKEGRIPLELDINEDEDGNIIFKTREEMPKCLTDKKDVLLYKNIIYMIPYSQREVLYDFLSAFGKEDTIVFQKAIANEVINTLIPAANEICERVYIDSDLEGSIQKEEASAELYFDRDDKHIWSTIKMSYGDISFTLPKGYHGEKLILRDLKMENEIIDMLEEYKFFKHKDKFIFRGSEDELYDFLDKDIQLFKKFGEIYYSDRFKSQKIYRLPVIKGEIKESMNYLEFTFQIEDINKNETAEILKAFQDNRRFYKLKNNSFLDLKGEGIQKFLKLIDDMDAAENLEDGSLKMPKSRAFYLKDVMNEKGMQYIHGKDALSEITDKITSVASVDYEVPAELNGSLREYQKAGYRWMKTLSHYEFGGILADEMGLGKTIQTIAFLLSEKGSTTLIITPTSLIYNWQKEFKKFAPSLKVMMLHGSKEERIERIKEAEGYDVILTTYGIVRNDFKEYEGVKFDYCIIDEGQNIKNPLSQNSNAIKNVNARIKFALTGTPLENNLIELWSIFDFIMPGYLYSGKTFQRKFMGKNADESMIHLKSMIKPFVLRRLKNDVMKELPDKIEKKFYVEMTEEQKKVYSTYVNEIRSKMHEKSFDGNKITIFSYLTKLRELCLDPSILVKDYKGGSGKMEAAIDMIKKNISQGKKILLFSQFTTVLKNIGLRLEREGIEYYYLDGSTKAIDRLRLVNEFNKRDDKKIFLISLKAGGTGLNLTSASVVIHFDPWWNPAVEDQATDRAHRFGQKEVVQVIKLIAEGSVEDKIVNLQESKKELIGKIISGDFKEGGLLKSMTKEELKDLFE